MSRKQLNCDIEEVGIATSFRSKYTIVVQEAVQDPTGFEVFLTEQCWAEHITIKHPEMSSHRDLVRETLRMPDAIHFGKRDPARRIYLKTFHHVAGIGNWLHLLVFVGNQDRHVATAYFTSYAMRMLGEQVWPSR